METYSPLKQIEDTSIQETNNHLNLIVTDGDTLTDQRQMELSSGLGFLDADAIRRRVEGIFRNTTTALGYDSYTPVSATASDGADVINLPKPTYAAVSKANLIKKVKSFEPGINAGRSIKIRSAKQEDIEELVEVDMEAFRSVYKHYDISSEELKNDLLEKFTRRYEVLGGQWITVLERKRRIVGFIAACPTSKPPEDFVSWEDTTDNGTLQTTYDPAGEYLYCVSLSVLPEGSKLGGQDMLMANLISQIMAGNYTAYFESRMPGLKRWMLNRCREDNTLLRSLPESTKQRYANEYFRLNTELEPGSVPSDPLLKLYHSMGCTFPKLVPNAYQDELSMDYGVVALYNNPLPEFVKKNVRLRKLAATGVGLIAASSFLTQKVF